MSSKIGLNLTRRYSPNFDIPKRNKKLIKFVIIHYTGMKKEKAAIKRLSDPNSKVSCHYFIKENGDILNLIPDLFVAWHAGISEWKKFKSLNKYSIGIEINNPGHEFGYKKFSKKQIVSIERLLKFLMKKFNVKKQNILGHSDVAPYRKKDPGEKFPWKKLADKKLCIWHSLDEKNLKKFRNSKLINYDQRSFFNNLAKIGYPKITLLSNNKKKILLIKAFQRKFRPILINGKLDKECLLISKSLLKY